MKTCTTRRRLARVPDLTDLADLDRLTRLADHLDAEVLEPGGPLDHELTDGVPAPGTHDRASLLVGITPRDGGFDLCVRPLAGHPVAELTLFTAPADWWGLGVVTTGWAAVAHDPGAPGAPGGGASDRRASGPRPRGARPGGDEPAGQRCDGEPQGDERDRGGRGADRLDRAQLDRCGLAGDGIDAARVDRERPRGGPHDGGSASADGFDADGLGGARLDGATLDDDGLGGDGRRAVGLIHLVCRGGAAVSMLRSPGWPHTTHRAAGPGRIGSGNLDDSCRRALRLPTAPPPADSLDLWRCVWLDRLLAEAAAGMLDHGSWSALVAHHPAAVVAAAAGEPDVATWVAEQPRRAAEVMARGLTWPRLRAGAIDGDGPVLGVSGPVAAWMDDGMYARAVLGGYPSPEELLDELSLLVPAAIHRRLVDALVDPS